MIPVALNTGTLIHSYEVDDAENSDLWIIIFGIYLGCRDKCICLNPSMKILGLRWKYVKTFLSS